MTRPRPSDFAGRRFWRLLAISTFTALGVIATAAGLFDVLVPDTLSKLGKAGAGTALAVSVAAGIARSWPRPVEQKYASPNITIRMIQGDLFDLQEHLVVGMSDTFDTAPGVIAATSVQAQFLDRVYGGDTPQLDQDLDAALDGVNHTAIGKAGKTKRYPVGTVATLGGPSRRFFCVALASMNERNEARGTIEGVSTSLNALWRAACAHANGGPVAMPVIGGGQSRLSQALAPADAIRLQALSFWLACREERVCGALTIVVPPDNYDALDRRDIQAFLTSLLPS